MAFSFSNQQTGDDYEDALTLSYGPATGAQFSVLPITGQPGTTVLVQAGVKDPTQRGTGRFISWDDPQLFYPSLGNQVTNCCAVRFKSAVKGQPVSVSAGLIIPDKPSYAPGAPTAQTINAGGGINPGPGQLTRVTVLPVAPNDLQQVMLDLNATWPGIEWLCTFDQATGWWDVIGQPLFAEVTNIEGTASGAYVDLAHAGPSITLPVFGGLGNIDTQIRWGASSKSDTVNSDTLVAVKFGAAATSDAWAALHVSGTAGANEWPAVMRSRRAAGLTANEVIKLQYRGDGAGDTATFGNRWIEIEPIRIQ